MNRLKRQRRYNSQDTTAKEHNQQDGKDCRAQCHIYFFHLNRHKPVGDENEEGGYGGRRDEQFHRYSVFNLFHGGPMRGWSRSSTLQLRVDEFFFGGSGTPPTQMALPLPPQR